MNRALTKRLFRSFEDIAHREGEVGYRLARELQELLGSAEWRNFADVIERAQDACEAAGYAVSDHIVGVDKVVDPGSGARRTVADVALTRHAAYLIAQNGGLRKLEIAFAESCFAVQTRKQELIEAREDGPRPGGPPTSPAAPAIARDRARAGSRPRSASPSRAR
jgi:DNA-damage-inducible protein D